MNDEVEKVIIGRRFLDLKRYMSPQVPSVWEQLVSYWYFKKGSKTERVHDWVSPSITEIALDTGLSPNTIKKCIKELTILGFITKTEHRLDNSNKYYLDDNPKYEPKRLEMLKEFRNVRRAVQTSPDDLLALHDG